MQRRQIGLVLILATILALLVTPVAARQYGVIPALGPWDGGPDRVLYCPGAAKLVLESLADGEFYRAHCESWSPSPLATPAPTPMEVL